MDLETKTEDTWLAWYDEDGVRTDSSIRIYIWKARQAKLHFRLAKKRAERLKWIVEQRMYRLLTYQLFPFPARRRHLNSVYIEYDLLRPRNLIIQSPRRFGHTPHWEVTPRLSRWSEMELENNTEEIEWPKFIELSLADTTRMHYGSIGYCYYSFMIRVRSSIEKAERARQRQMQSMIDDANRANLKWIVEQNRKAHRKQKRAHRRKVKLGW